jgi:hypothetical protein
MDSKPTMEGTTQREESSSSAGPAVQHRAKNEALLTAGMGYGNKKRAQLEAFWSIVWPGLLSIGWKAVRENDK